MNKNSWEELIQIQKLFTEQEISKYPVLDSFEKVWDRLENVEYTWPDETGEHQPIFKRTDGIGVGNPLNTLLSFIEQGFYPPPEYLIWLLECFEFYTEQSGKVELEEVFFGNKKNEENFASQKRRKSKYEIFTLQYNMNKQRTQAEVFEICQAWFGDDFQDIDQESFLRGWRRWKRKL